MRRDGRKTPLQAVSGSVLLPQEQQRLKKSQPGQSGQQRGIGPHQRGDGITAGDLRHDHQRPPDHQVVQEIEGQGEPAGSAIQTNEETDPGGVLCANVIEEIQTAEHDQGHAHLEIDHGERIGIEAEGRDEIADDGGPGTKEARIGAPEAQADEQAPDDHEEGQVALNSTVHDAPAEDEPHEREEGPGQEGKFPGEEEAEENILQFPDHREFRHRIHQDPRKIVRYDGNLHERPAPYRRIVDVRPQPGGGYGDAQAQGQNQPGGQEPAEEQDHRHRPHEGQDVPLPYLAGSPRQGQHEDTGQEYVSAADERPLEQRERIVGPLVRRQHLAHAHHHQKTGRPPNRRADG